MGLSAIGSEIAGRLFGLLYVLKADTGASNSSTSSDNVAEYNLATLSRAASHVERGDLRSAVVALEALQGECRSRATSWIADARHALLLQQGARAVVAKARCLNALLVQDDV